MKDECLSVKRNPKEDIKYYRSIDYSGFFERLFARGIDLFILIGLGYFIYKKLGIMPAIITVLISDLLIRISFTYFFGATLGKLIFRIKVISRCTDKLSFFQVLIRETFKYISELFLNFGYVFVIFNRRKLAWHDIAACTAVISGGKEEAEYAKEIYKERPQKWNIWICVLSEIVLILIIIFSVNRGAFYLVYDKGMLGYLKYAAYSSPEFVYKLPHQNDINKEVIQIGDINGDGKCEIFREGYKDDKVFINKTIFAGSAYMNSDIEIQISKPIIQYRLLDMDGDKKDELAVLLEDMTLKLYKYDGKMNELASYGPLKCKKVISMVKDRPNLNRQNKLYILDEDNGMFIISLKDKKIVVEEQKLPLEYKFSDIDVGILDGGYYMIGITKDDMAALFDIENKFSLKRTMKMPIKGEAAIKVLDMNLDGKDEVFILSYPSDKRTYPLIAAYDINSNGMKMMWNGGSFYNDNGNKVLLSLNDKADIDKNGKIELYMISQKRSETDVSFSLYIFEEDRLLQKAAKIIQSLILFKPE